MDLSLRSSRPRASRIRPLQMWRRIDSLLNATSDMLENDLLQDIKRYPRYVPTRVDPRSRLLLSHARSGIPRCQKTSPARVNAKNTRAPVRPSRARNPIQIDKLSGW